MTKRDELIALGGVGMTNPDREELALELAYGLLWIVGSDRSTTNGNALYLARKALYERISKDGQARGITAARAAITDNPFHNLPDPVDTGIFPRTNSRPGDASISGATSNRVAAVRDDGDTEWSTSEAGLSAVERLWNPFQTCSTTDNRPVELRFQNGDVKHGYFSSSQRRWVDASGAPLEEGLYPSHWRAALTAPGATTKSDGDGCEMCFGTGRHEGRFSINGPLCSYCGGSGKKSDVEALAATTAERPGTVTSEPEPSTSDPFADKVPCHCHDAVSQRLCLDKDRCYTVEAQSRPSGPSSARSEVTVESLAETLCKACGDYWWQSTSHSPENARWIKRARALLDQFEIRRK